MKKVLFLIVLVSSIGYSQTQISGFKLVDKKVKWQHVFEVTNYPADSLQQIFITNVLSKINTNNLNELPHRVTFTINNDEVDFRKYGGKWGNTWLFVEYALNYFVIIDFKDNKYRVTCSDVKTVFIPPLGVFKLNNTATKKRQTIFTTNKTVLRGLSYLEKHLKGKFNLKTALKENNNW